MMAMSARRATPSLGAFPVFGAAVLAIGAGWLVWAAVRHEVDVSAAPAPAVKGAATLVSASRSASRPAPPLADLSETLRRPLFEPDRRPRPVEPPATAAAAAASPGATQQLRVVGIMKGQGGTSPSVRALVRTAAAPQGVWVEQGGSLDGWKVAAIGDRTVVVEGAGRRVELGLFVSTATDR
jgi:hypothetical protein